MGSLELQQDVTGTLRRSPQSTNRFINSDLQQGVTSTLRRSPSYTNSPIHPELQQGVASASVRMPSRAPLSVSRRTRSRILPTEDLFEVQEDCRVDRDTDASATPQPDPLPTDPELLFESLHIADAAVDHSPHAATDSAANLVVAQAVSCETSVVAAVPTIVEQFLDLLLPKGKILDLTAVHDRLRHAQFAPAVVARFAAHFPAGTTHVSRFDCISALYTAARVGQY